MRRLQAYKYELMPNGEQQRDMRRFSGACRFVFNKALALQKANTQAGEKFIGYVAMAKRLTDWRNGLETPWLKDAPCHPLQHALKDLERAYHLDGTEVPYTFVSVEQLVEDFIAAVAARRAL